MIAVIVPFGQVSLPADTFVRLDEWARWARPRLGIPNGRCASAEGRYDSTSDNGRGIDSLGDYFQVDLAAVLAVERVVCTRLPELSREVVRHHFILRSMPQVVARSLGIHRAHYGRELRRAVLMIKNNLTRK